jgi:peroxiredoxin
MRYVYLLTVLLCIIGNYLFANSVKLTIKGCNDTSIILYSVKGESLTIIDTFYSTGKGQFELNLKKGTMPGLFRVIFNKNNRFDFLFDNEDIEIKSDFNNLLDSVVVVKSQSNMLFYDFIKQNKEYKIKNELLQFILDRYPKNEEYYNETVKTLTKLQEEYLYFVNMAAVENKGKFIAKYIKSSQLPILPISLKHEDKIKYLRSNALNNVDFSDEALINSDVFTNKSIEYLTYFSNPQLQKKELELEFMKAVDSILQKAKINKNVYTQIVEYYIKGFREFGFDIIINYLLDNYVIKDDLCIEDKLEIALERRINQSKIFKVGNKVPNITITDQNNKNINLYEINAKEILIVFYSSACPHCITQLPKIFEYYKKQTVSNFQVLAISMDTNKEEWLKYITENKFDWVNANDLKGWESKAVSDYSVYATPTFILVDKDKRVISVPIEFP